MFEKLTAPHSKEREIEPGSQTLGEPPVLRDYIQGHPKNSELLKETLAELGLNLDTIKSIDREYIRHIKELLEQSSDEKMQQLLPIFADLEEIVFGFDSAVKEYEESEDKVFANLTLNGEKFSNKDVNRLIVKLRDEDGYWEDVDENTTIPSFNNEWQRLYQVVRNEDPQSTLGFRRKISKDILSIFINNKSEAVVSDDDEGAEDEINAAARHYNHDDTSARVEYDRESIYAQLDNYFDVANLEQRFIPTTIDLLFQAQELEKERVETFADDPAETVDWYREENQRDREVHESRDVTYKIILHSYVEERLKPRLDTVFEELKYQSVMDAWDNNNDDYTNYSEIALPVELHKKFYSESNKNKVDTHYRENIQVGDELLLAISKDSYAEYVGNDTFLPLDKASNEQYEVFSVKALLKKNGLKGYPLTNDGIGEYRSLMDLRVLASLKEKFGVDIRDLSIKEQYFFLGYLKRVTPASLEMITRFTSLYGVDGMRTFLSLERGDETLGDHIIAFGQHDEMAGTVFKYYGELLNSAERAEALVREVSDCEGDICAELVKQVRENIINRAQKDLEKVVRSHDLSEVAAQIENYVADAKEYVALLQEIGAGNIESVSPESLTEEEQMRMQDLLQTNYNKVYPGPEDEVFKSIVAGSLTKSFSNPNTTFRVLRDNGKIVSYNRFDTISDCTGKELSYFGSFNADPAYSGVGGVMLEETIKDRLEDGRPMMAQCDPSQAITKKYIEDGFVGTQFYELAGKPIFDIWRTKDSTAQLESKEKSIEELLTSTENSGRITVREQSDAETYPELKNNMGLTRYFTHQGKTYLVFQELPENLRNDFTQPKEDIKEAA